METVVTRGKHQITIKNLSPEAKIDIQFNGVKVYMFCEGYIDTFISIFNSLLAFVGGLGDDPSKPIINPHVPEYMEKANLEFL